MPDPTVAPQEAVPSVATPAAASLGHLLDALLAEHPSTRHTVAQLRVLLAAHEQREAELRALVDAARDLTKVRDLDRTLQAVTDRTRRLLDCDVAYLSARTLDDEHFAVRAWAGQLSPSFLGTRVGVGSGVGGEVASRRRPFQVDDYQSAAEFPHSDYLDQQVGAEGLVTLLGVPLEVDGRLLGILFAGRRRRELFSQRQVDLMSSLAAHAAVALDNALLFHSQSEALDELERSSALLRAHTAAVETSAEVHGRLTEAQLRGEGVDRIVQVIADSLDASITMIDDSGGVLSSHGLQAPLPPYPFEVSAALASSMELGRSVAAARFDGLHWRVSAAMAGARYLGAVVLTCTRELHDVEVRTLERATQTIAVSLLADVAAAEADIRAAGENMRILLSGRRSHSDAGQRLARRHGLAEAALSIAACEVSQDRLPAQISACTTLCEELGGLAALHEDHVVVVSPQPADRLAEALWRRIERAVGRELTVVAAGGGWSLDDLPAGHRETVQAFHLMARLGRSGQWATSAEFGIYSLLLTPEATATLAALIDRTIGPLLDYDRRHNTRLWQTALAYLDASRNATSAAGTLGIHVNTVAQRLHRIDRLLGAGWRESRQLEVHHALRLQQLRADSAGT